MPNRRRVVVTGIGLLSSMKAINDALGRLRNILAELAALYLALTLVPENAAVTVVHDYEGVGAWMEGRWKAKDPVVAAVVAACRALIERRRLRVGYRHQRGHRIRIEFEIQIALHDAFEYGLVIGQAEGPKRVGQ